MQPNSSGSLIDRVIAWLRGLLGAGKSAADSTAREVRHTAREGVDDAGRRIHNLADRRDQRDTGATATGTTGSRDLPNLGDEASAGGRSGFDASASTPSARDAAAPYRAGTAEPEGLIETDIDVRSDFEDAPGEIEPDEDAYPPGGDLGSATHVHDAVGGEDERADEDTDAIDTTRDDDLRPGGTEGYQDREIPLQDQLIVDEGASSDEFDGDEITPGDVDTRYVSPADVESAAEGYGDETNTDLANTTDAGTSTLTGSTFTQTDVVVPPDITGNAGQQGDVSAPDEGGSFHVVERYNYGVGDLGVGAGTTPDDAWADDTGPDVTTADIESGVDADINAVRQGGQASDTGASPNDGGGSQAGSDAGDRGTTETVVGNAGMISGDATFGFRDTVTSGEEQTDGKTAAERDREAAYDSNAGEDVSAQASGSGIVESVDVVPEDAVSGTPGDVNATVSPDATREEIEYQSRGDAVNKSDEATQTPGFGAPETFGEADTGTTEPSRSATGNTLDDEQDALGTTLDYEAESDAFNEDAANLSSEDELTISDANLDDDSRNRGGDERVATFQSGTIAQEGLVGENAAIDEEVTNEAYADIPDEPRHETADDTGLDDFSGSDYPSDRRVDLVDGDDFTNAEVPDVPDLDSSAGDLSAPSTDAAEQVDYVTQPVERTVGDAGSRLDQDILASTDETVGEDESDLEATASMDVEEAGAQSLTGTGTTGAADMGSGSTVGESAPAAGGHADIDNPGGVAPGGQISESSREGHIKGGGGPAAGGGRSAPAGSVPGDGGTEAPEGYPVKGNANSMIYHLPDFPSYAGTKAEFYFATEQDAINAGYRAPGNVRRRSNTEASGGSAGSPAGDRGSDAALAAAERGEVTTHEHGIRRERPRDDAEVASETPTGVVTEADASGESRDSATYPPAAAASETTGTLSDESEANARGDAGTSSDVPAGAVRGDGGTDTPDGYPVKGNASSMIYHLPSFPSYKSTKAEYCFATEQDAIDAGYRAPGKRNRGRKS